MYFFAEMNAITILTFETIFTREYKGLIKNIVTWCYDSHLKLIISKTNEFVVDYQRGRRPPILVVMQMEEARSVSSSDSGV